MFNQTARNTPLLCALFITAGFFSCEIVHADLIWDGSTNAIWSTADNWTATGGDTAPPGTGDTATFNNAGNGNTTISLAGIAINRINISASSAAAYTFGSGGINNETMSIDISGQGIDIQSGVTNAQKVDAKMVFGNGSSNTVEFANNSGSSVLTLAGDIEAGTGGTAGTQTLRFTGYNNSVVGKTIISGDIDDGGANQFNLEIERADVTLSGNLIDGAVTLRKSADAKLTVTSTGSLTSTRQLFIDEGEVELQNNQNFANVVNFGQATRGNSDATLTIGDSNTVSWSAGSILYRADDDTANQGFINGGTLQLTGGNRTIIVNNNAIGALADSANPEMTITSTITSDGSGTNGDRDLTIRNTGGGTLLLAPSGTANSFGGVTLQEGNLLLGAGALSSEGDFLTIAARNDASTSANTVATVDLRGTTHALGNGTGTAGVGGTLSLGADDTSNIGTNGFQANLTDTVGGGKLTNVNAIVYRNGTGSGDQRNGAATISVDLDFDTSGVNKATTIQDGSAATDLVISSAFNTTGDTTHDFEFLGDGTLQISGTLGRLGTVNGHDRTYLRNQKTILGAGADISGSTGLNVEQRNNATFSDFDVELDINGQDLVLNDQLVVSAFATNNVTAISNTYITDSAGGGRLVFTGSTDGNRTLLYNAAGGTNKTTFISADLRTEGNALVFSVNDGADAIDLDVSGSFSSDNNTRQLSKTGTGTLRLSATDNTSGMGVMVIQNGRVVITNTGAIGSDDIQLGFGTTSGILEYTGGTGTINEQIRIGDSNASSGRVGSGVIENNGTGGLTFGTAIFNQARTPVTEARTLTIGGTNAGDNIISGAIVDNNSAGGGTVAINKTGTNTWILDGNNSYTGTTTVSAGTLVINGDQSAATGVVSVAAGATLKGSGTVGGVTTILGTHAAGQSAGIQTFVDDLTYQASANVEWELFANSESGRGSNFDGMDLSGGLLTINGGSVDLIFDSPGSTVTNNGFWFADRQWTIYQGASSVAGMFTNLNPGTGVPTPGFFSLDYSTGTSVVLNWTTTVPEPTTFMMFGLGLATFGFSRRRKRLTA